MKFKEKLAIVFRKTRTLDKAKRNQLTSKDWDRIRAAYKKEFGSDLDADRDADEGSSAAAADNAAAVSIVENFLAKHSIPSPNGDAKPAGKPGSATEAATALVSAVSSIFGQAFPDNAKTVNGRKLLVAGQATTAKHLFGIEHNAFSMESRFNKIAVNPGLASAEPATQAHGESFFNALGKFAQRFGNRINFHKTNRTLNYKVLRQSLDSDPGFYLGGNAGLGDQFVTMRHDEIIARLLELLDVYNIFPRRYGVQDREVITNAFFDELSQAYQEGHVYKGRIDLKPEVGYVDDGMMKAKFGPYKDLERQYIGYLNENGSDPIKWNMIEWALFNYSKKLLLEQHERRILGIFLKPEDKVPGHYMNTGTGVFYTLIRYYNEGKMALVDDPAFSSYDSGTTFVELVRAMALMLSRMIPNFRNEYEVILNGNDEGLWRAGIREIFGKDTDFTGPFGDVIPDTRIPIKWCPYWNTMPIVLFQKAGNIKCLEYEPGEMFKFGFDREMELVRIYSYWKEGTSAGYVGRPFESKAACAANEFKEQVIFMNKPALTIPADATTITAEKDIRIYVTGENTASAAITDIVDAKQGFAYMIEAGSDTNLPTIAKSGKFSEITADFTPTQKYDYILVAARDKDVTKFYELERMVGGVRKINQAIQPNVPGPGGRI